MKKFIFLLLFTSSSVVLANWKLVTINEQGDKFYVESNSIHKINNFIRVWEKSEYNKEALGMKSSRVYQEYDCVERKSRTLSFQSFKQNNLVEIDSSSNVSSEWRFIPPDTIAFSIFKFVCKK